MIEEKERMIRLLNALFPGVKIYLFGSRARGDHRPSSDIDIALDMGSEMSIYDIAMAKNVLESLYIPQKIDVVDLNAVSKNMQKNILNEGISWT